MQILSSEKNYIVGYKWYPPHSQIFGTMGPTACINYKVHWLTI